MPKNEGKSTSKSMRCPDCHSATLNTPCILIRMEGRKRKNIPFKVCWRCKIVIISERAKLHNWKFWNGEVYLDTEA